MSELARLVPADWVRRGNLGGGFSVRVAGKRSAYSPAEKQVRIGSGAHDDTLLHEYVHYLQEMHSDIEGLVYAFHRRQKRGKRSGLDTGPVDWNAETPKRTYSFMAYADREYPAYGQHTGGTVIAGIEARARGLLCKAPANVAVEGLWGMPLEVLTTTLEVMLGRDPRNASRLALLIEKDPDLFDFVLGLLLGYGGP